MKQLIQGEKFLNQYKCDKPTLEAIRFEDCVFDRVALFDVKLKDVEFVGCTFKHVILESFNATNVVIKNSEIRTLTLSGDRIISRRRLFGAVTDRSLRSVIFEDNTLGELSLGGNLCIDGCRFPTGEFCCQIKDPFAVYTACQDFVDKNWQGEAQRIGRITIQLYLNKGVEKQNQDFVYFKYNLSLDKETNDVLEALFYLIREVGCVA